MADHYCAFQRSCDQPLAWKVAAVRSRGEQPDPDSQRTSCEKHAQAWEKTLAREGLYMDRAPLLGSV